jgi:hypothetical protein
MQQEFSALIGEAGAIAEDAGRTFGALDREQLNWKPAESQWSVAQCFDHLIKINSTYLPQLQRIEQGSYSPTWRDRVPWAARLFGSLVLNAVKPESPRKYKAARFVDASPSAIDEGIIARFMAHQQEVVEHMKRTGGRDVNAIVLKSPVAPVVFYSLLDAFRIIVAHERRHMAQAERVVKSEGFPRAR